MPSATCQPGLACEVKVGANAQSGDDSIGDQFIALLGAHHHLARPALQPRATRRPGSTGRLVACNNRSDKPTERGGKEPAEQAVFEEEHGDLLAERGQGSGNFGTDKTAADDDEAGGALGLGAQVVIIGQGAVVDDLSLAPGSRMGSPPVASSRRS